MQVIARGVLIQAVGLLTLLAIEGLLTMGAAFDFSSYTFVAWVAQALLIIATVSGSYLISDSFDDKRSI